MRRNIEQIGQQIKQQVRQQFRKSNPPTVHRSGLMVVLVLESARAFAQSQQAAPAPLEPIRRIVVSIPDRKLALVEDGRVIKIYQVAVGAHVSPTPSGVFTIANRILLPTYYAPGIVLAPDPGNPLGTRWIGLSVELVAQRTEEILSIFGGHAAAEPVLSVAANAASAPLAQ